MEFVERTKDCGAPLRKKKKLSQLLRPRLRDGAFRLPMVSHRSVPLSPKSSYHFFKDEIDAAAVQRRTLEVNVSTRRAGQAFALFKGNQLFWWRGRASPIYLGPDDDEAAVVTSVALAFRQPVVSGRFEGSAVVDGEANDNHTTTAIFFLSFCRVIQVALCIKHTEVAANAVQIHVCHVISVQTRLGAEPTKRFEAVGVAEGGFPDSGVAQQDTGHSFRHHDGVSSSAAQRSARLRCDSGAHHR